MAPIATSDLNPAKTSVSEMDPTVFPSPKADERLRRLWNLHGDPHSSKFSNPKLTSIAKLVEHNASVQPSQAAFIYPVGSSFSVLDWSTLHDLSCKAAAYYADRLQDKLEEGNAIGKQPTIALLGTGNSIDYLITQIALNSLRLRVLLLSNKNAPETREHLLRVCSAVAIITDKANEASLHGEQACQLPAVSLIGLADLHERPSTNEEKMFAFSTNDEWNLQSMIIHSSGSTGVPKPVIHTNRSLCQIARMYRLLPEYYIENWYLCFPLFHVAGLSIAVSGLPTGLPTTLPPEQWPPAPSSILSAWRALEDLGYPADCLHCAPSVIEDLYEYITLTTKDYTPLTKLKVLQPGGAPLSPNVLSKIQALGVNVKTTYGTSETGPPFRTIPHTRDNPDVYRFRNLYPESPFVRMESVGDGLFECVVFRGFPLAAELWPDDASPNPYRTGDLFLEDPPASGYFVLQGRRDDILIYSNGEKTHASAVAMALEEDKTSVIAKTAVFGTGKPCPSVVVEVKWQAAEGLGLVNLNDEVWRVVQRCNGKLATFSRIPRETIVILNKGETLPVTPKGNVRRNTAWELYGDRVEELYSQFLGDGPDTVNGSRGTQVHESSPLTIEVIQKAVAEVFELPQEDIREDLNWYEIGLDSLNAVDLRSRLVRSFGSFPLMFIFEFPTVRKLLEFLTRPGEDDFDQAAVTSQHHEWIQSTIRRMNEEVDLWRTQRPTALESKKEMGDCIYLTGASGFLGNALLEVMVRSTPVTKIYCAVRGSNPQARVVESLVSRGYSKDIYESDKICAVNYDMRDRMLGLDEPTYQRITDEVTVVMHNAWKLDFNQPIQQYEEDCLKGTMNLMSFCLKGPTKSFAFMNPALALPTGYAQSKFIIEQVTQHFAASLSIPTRILRVGQLCGHSRLGTWNHTEMWPIMMMTALNLLSAMPVLQTTVDWLPVDVCAETIKKVVLDSDAQSSYTVTNLTNPSTTSWEELLDCLEKASRRNIDRVGMKDWVSRLELMADSDDASGQEIPALKLLGFFQGMVNGSANGEDVEFESGKVENGRKINVEAVRKWLVGWENGGHIM
ncbi:ochratoxin a non-ribosomal peptide synthetase [Colletotrichum karsti]|uniref:Ochratoxin a non-ribosomal peptide synthetase n=1 Tax=Colletotrichum karsti TaxID=1095194 RepID=A0A9P6IEC0_9PEZI|nr:ochratoxin a non-ribosomal peptide synthetase [Colletotrichum karsti]KAF9880822.1 ochratoxin a non-ribosomal peptide synthetase [Colletotrichum karsti]